MPVPSECPPDQHIEERTEAAYCFIYYETGNYGQGPNDWNTPGSSSSSQCGNNGGPYMTIDDCNRRANGTIANNDYWQPYARQQDACFRYDYEISVRACVPD